jgi:hypothetical protein
VSGRGQHQRRPEHVQAALPSPGSRCARRQHRRARLRNRPGTSTPIEAHQVAALVLRGVRE